MASVNTGLGSSFLKFTFTDDDGEVVSSFRINPLDVKLAQRFQEASSFFEDLRKEMPETATMEDVVKLNADIEEKICYILGYDAKESLFGQISATSVLGDGTMFINLVVEKIFEHIGPEMEKRQKSMAAAVEKHTAKYTK